MLHWTGLLMAVAAPVWAAEPGLGFGFERNQGQVAAPVRYLARTPGAHVFFTDGEIVFDPAMGNPVRLRFEGGNTAAQWQPVGAPIERTSYFLGKDSSRWVREAPVYAKLALRDAYPGVDVVCYARDGKLEYDLELAAGADTSPIRIHWSGGARLLDTGAIEAGAVRQKAPKIYQDGTEGRREIAGRFMEAGTAGRYRLELGKYDRDRPLVVDPLLEIATYIGGEGDDEIVSAGPGFVAGNTRSILFPDARVTRRRSRDVFVRGTDAAGAVGSLANTAITGTVIFGGSDDEEVGGAGITTLGQPFIWVAGTTRSRDFGDYKGGESDGFVAGLSIGQGLGLRFTNVAAIGGSGEDRITAIAVFSTTYAVAGVTDSPDLPAQDAPQTSLSGGRDAFYAYPTSGRIAYGYVGGSADDAALAIDWRGVSQLVIGGETRSADFPGVAASSASFAGAADGFITLANVPFGRQLGTELSMSSWLTGGTGEDRINGITCTSTSPREVDTLLINRAPPQCVFAGTTSSTDLPVRNAAQAGTGGGGDIFAGAWDPFTGSFPWLTYVGGPEAEEARSVAMNWNGDLYLGGFTRSGNLPVVDAVQPVYGGGDDGLFALLERGGQLRQLTYFGGSGDDRIQSVLVTKNNLARVAGSTTSRDLTEVRSWQRRSTGQEGFVADIGTAYLAGPDELIVPKDGAVRFSLRSGQERFGAVTYRSSDPSRVRIAFEGRTAGEITAPAEANIIIEGLADEGTVEVTASSPGHATKTIAVRLYPGVLAPAFPSRLTTWSGPQRNIFVQISALEASTNRLIGFAASLRSGLNVEVRWSSADPGVLEVEVTVVNGLQQTIVHPRRAGTAALTVTAGSLVSRPLEVTVVEPELVTNPIALGGNTVGRYTASFRGPDLAAIRPVRGTLTLRSENPELLRIGPAGGRAGESITVALSGPAPALELQALASTGEVRLIATSPEFTGERVIPVTLEPLVATMAIEGSPAILPLTDRRVRVSLTTPSNAGVGGFRPGTPPMVFRLAASNPRVLELNRLTVIVPAPDGQQPEFLVRGLAAGECTLTLTSESGVEIRNPQLTLRVGPSGAATRFEVSPREVVVGNNLQTQLSINTLGNAALPVRVRVDDPGAAQLAADQNANGVAELVLRPAGSISFWIQALRGEGETRLRLSMEGSPDQEVKAIFVPSGFGAVPQQSAGPGTQSYSVSAFALEETTGGAITPQLLRPGVRGELRFRVEGTPVDVSPETATLDSRTMSVTLNVAAVPAGADSTLVVEQPEGFTASPLVSRVSLAPRPESPVLSAINGLEQFAARGAVSVVRLLLGGTLRGALTVASGDPQKLLLSTSATAAGQPSVEMAAGSNDAVYLHGLADSGTVRVRVTGGATTVAAEFVVRLIPLRAAVSGVELLSGRTGQISLSLLAGAGSSRGYSPRPENGPMRFRVRSSDPRVFTLRSDVIDVAAGQNTATLEVTGVAPGTANIILEDGPAGVMLSGSAIVTVRNPRFFLNGQVTRLTLGRNLQLQLRVSLDASPNAGIARVTSSHPARLLVSRNESAEGTGSTTFAVPARSSEIGPLYLQALEGSGEANVTIALDGYAEAVLNVRLVPSWIQLSGTGLIGPGGRTTLTAFLRFDDPAPAPGGSTGLRAGIGPVRVNIRPSPAGVISAPAQVELRPGVSSFPVEVTATGLGEVELALDAAPFFDAPPTEEGPFLIEVRAGESPRLTSDCGALVLVKDSQSAECAINVPAGVVVTVRSEDPERLLVSNAPNSVGQAQAVGNRITLQALAAEGTVEAVASAPGYREHRFAVAMRPSGFAFVQRLSSGSAEINITGSNPIQLRVGLASAGVLSDAREVTPRAGLNVPVEVTVAPGGVVTLEPARLTFGVSPESRQLSIRPVTAGNTVVRLLAPAGFVELAAGTVAVRVVP